MGDMSETIRSEINIGFAFELRKELEKDIGDVSDFRIELRRLTRIDSLYELQISLDFAIDIRPPEIIILR